ncbi:hypothetical protein EN836_31050 [Mesorhizobium sp. M1C.F.Ca.ET.193.01.1.1]|nr:hypothetical protein EJ074_18855 [Mesorhizobium sp. M3A.F.Ca.ET.080.04.2.1]RWA67837.1 MAG: hypothetical protein EOQ29_21970 [Mesorhizobium sp.]TGQ50030.1 hypothetical protein EN853_31040 [Mesorhizobium sp. M1C.F.Ca.ET.210.01.1.1]TGQ62761.1 hypothetical protein EN848_32065 [bacterium M00.F.Ca.ET.205.01.1.1]TGQ64484.1 hypothetical protein EN855_031055 [Mesorhizobium sp. M1C.F.Ca.ET.212.01.1.1]TGQ98342.1 hypothetical protein EN847_31040 [Mesorhizobium sp. M1C.F.Ca.ET.204.01.1.1]TGR18616.1 hyp
MAALVGCESRCRWQGALAARLCRAEPSGYAPSRSLPSTSRRTAKAINMREGTTSASQRWPTRLDLYRHGTRLPADRGECALPLITCITTLGKGKTDPDRQNVRDDRQFGGTWPPALYRAARGRREQRPERYSSFNIAR